MSRRPSLEEIVSRLRSSHEENDDSSSSDEETDEYVSDSDSSYSATEDPQLYEQSSDGDMEVEEHSSYEEASSASSSVGSASDGVTSDVDRDVDHVVSPSGIIWKFNAPRGRLLGRNIIAFRDGPTISPASELHSFLCFITEDMIRTTLRFTNRRLRALKKKIFSYDEFTAGLATIIRAGVDRNNMSALSTLYTPADSRPFYRCALSKNRLKLLLSHITFDNKVTRRERQQSDKLAAVREFWNMFNSNLRRHYIPSPSMTVDEQLYAFRGYAPGRSYMPQKPAKYGIKIFWLCDAKNGYALNALPYCGAEGSRNVGLAKTVVLKLTEPYYNTNRNIFIDRYFSSFDLCVNLLQNGLTSTGTIMSSRRGVPQLMKVTRGVPIFETRNLWNHENRILLSSYVPKKNKNVLMLSSLHTNNPISSRDDKKPEIIMDYNKGKGGVDVMDSRVEDFTCRRKTRRYTLLHFFNMIDVALLNSFLIMEASGYSKSRATFIKDVTLHLAERNIKTRYNNRMIYAQTRSAFTALGFPVNFIGISSSNNKPKKCQETHCRKSTRKLCSGCRKYVCSDHHTQQVLCSLCAL